MHEKVLQKHRLLHQPYLWVAVVWLLVLAGFGSSYYFRLASDKPALTGLLHLHGLLLSLWLLLFAAQIWLVANRRVDWHRRLGRWGIGLAALVVVVAAATALVAAKRDMPGDPSALEFLAQPLFDLLVFTILIGAAWFWRRRRDVHGRLMILANLSILAPAIARLPFGFIGNGGPYVIFALNDVVVLAFVLYDSLAQRRLHPAIAWGALFIVLTQPARVLVGAWPTWITVMGNLLS